MYLKRAIGAGDGFISGEIKAEITHSIGISTLKPPIIQRKVRNGFYGGKKKKRKKKRSVFNSQLNVEYTS